MYYYRICVLKKHSQEHPCDIQGECTGTYTRSYDAEFVTKEELDVLFPKNIEGSNTHVEHSMGKNSAVLEPNCRIKA